VADVSVRPASPSDAERVAEVQLRAWRAGYADLLPAAVLEAPVEEVAAAWRRSVEAAPPGHRLLLAMDGAQVVGLAASGPADDDADGVELTALLVDPDHGRRGHGSRLLAASVDLWRQDGVTRAVAWLWEDDVASRSLLTSAGWALDGAVRDLDTGERLVRQVRLHVSLTTG
jgi:GNAT superfamily N-acetyltransferase